MKMKTKISQETIRRMDALSKMGVGDKEIAKRMGMGTNVVAIALAKVSPDGRVMETQYGDKCNNPTYARSGRSVGLVDEVPVLDFLHGRRHA